MLTSKSIQEEQAVTWLGQFTRHGGPRYVQLADFIERALNEGALLPGDRLPPQRRVAELLKVDLTTVTRGYDEAKRRHLLEGRGARGTYAAAPKVDLHQALDLSMNIPPPPAGLDFGDLLKRGLAQVLLRSDTDLLMTYHLGGGSMADRAAAALWLRPVLPRVDTGQLLVCPGAQAALAALILALTGHGDALAAEPAIYPGLRAAAAQLGRRVVSVPVDAEGMLPDLLEKACRQHRVRAVYLNPTLQNPTARTMPEQRRRALLLVAARCGVQIIEDDPYSLLATDAPPPLAQLLPAQVCYVATLSKCLAPGLRTAYVVMPDPLLRERFLTALRSFSLMVPPLTTSLATQWIHDGSAQQLLEGIRQEAAARRALSDTILARTGTGTADGIHLWLQLPGYWNAQALAFAAQAQGVAVASSTMFYDGAKVPGAILPGAIRVSLGSIRERAHLAAALKKLALLLSQRPTAGTQTFI
jgi:DNA-binding transcriptional MocR family regulator